MNVGRITQLARSRKIFVVLSCVLTLDPAIAYTQQPSTLPVEPPRDSRSQQTISQLREAAALLATGRAAEAEPLLRQLLTANPNNYDAHNLLGIVLDQAGRRTEAQREYESAIRLNPKGVSALVNLGVLFARTNRSEQAIQTFNAVIQMAPDHPEATVNLGLEYSLRGDHALAVPLLQRAIGLGRDTYQVRYRLGIALYSLRRLDEAVTAFESAAALSPTVAEPAYYLGLISSARGKSEAAVAFWEQGLALRPNFPEANFMIGEELRKHRNYHRAEMFYERALNQDSSKLVYYVRLGGVYLFLIRYEDALKIFRRAADRFPQVAEAHYFLGVAARGLASYDLALTEFRKTLSLQPDNVDALAQLGFLTGERGDFAEAEKLLQCAIALSGEKHFFAHYDLGKLLIKQKRYDEAIPVLERSAVLKSTNPDVHYQLFVGLSRLKRKAAADRELTLFRKLDIERKLREKAGDSEQNDYVESSLSPPPVPPDQ